jgi:hypothetical protein
VGEKGRETLVKGNGAKPKIKPKRSGQAVTSVNFGDGLEGLDPQNNIFPDMSIKVMAVAKILGVRPTILPTKPASPRSVGIRVIFCVDFERNTEF